MAEKKEKVVKEAKFKALKAEDSSAEVAPKKKRASGKRKPKPKTEDVPKEEVSLPEINPVAVKTIDNTREEMPVVNMNNVKLPDMPEVMQIENKLSKPAEGWMKWLALQRMTPEDFIKRYPTHKMRHFIDEIIEFNTQKQ